MAQAKTLITMLPHRDKHIVILQQKYLVAEKIVQHITIKDKFSALFNLTQQKKKTTKNLKTQTLFNAIHHKGEKLILQKISIKKQKYKK